MNTHNDYSSPPDAKAGCTRRWLAFRRSNCITNALAPQDGAARESWEHRASRCVRVGYAKSEWQPRESIISSFCPYFAGRQVGRRREAGRRMRLINSCLHACGSEALTTRRVRARASERPCYKGWPIMFSWWATCALKLPCTRFALRLISRQKTPGDGGMPGRLLLCLILFRQFLTSDRKKQQRKFVDFLKTIFHVSAFSDLENAYFFYFYPICVTLRVA